MVKPALPLIKVSAEILYEFQFNSIDFVPNHVLTDTFEACALSIRTYSSILLTNCKLYQIGKLVDVVF